MKILALETSTSHGGAAVVVDGKLVSEHVTDRQRSHSELLHVFVEKALADAGLTLEEIDAFAVGQGPGSFTGIRVAANAGRAFAEVFNKPLVPVDTLTQIAWSEKDRSRPILVLMNAFKNLVYFGLFETQNGQLVLTKGPGAVPFEEVPMLVSTPVTVVGDGYDVAKSFWTSDTSSHLMRSNDPIDGTSPGVLGQIAQTLLEDGRDFHWSVFLPLYVRASEAEEKQRERLFNSPDAKDATHGKDRRST